MDVYLLWHVHHAERPDGRTPHGGDGSAVEIDEYEGDDVKLLGVYSSPASAHERQARASLLPGFRDEPRCYVVDTYEVDDDAWTEGFVTV